MPLYTSEAIVIRKIDYGEADRIITFLTPDHGKLAGIAKGAKSMRSRFGASLEVLTYGSLVYYDRQGKTLITIKQFDIITSFQQNRQDLIRSSSCQYMAELIYHFIPEQEAVPEVFMLFRKSMEGMLSTRDTEAVLRLFEIYLLHFLGFGPQMDACVHCGKIADHYDFSMRESGLLCPSCSNPSAEIVPVTAGVLFFWSQAMKMKSDKIHQVRLQGRLNTELKRLTQRYIRRLVGKEIRSYRFLESLLKEG